MDSLLLSRKKKKTEYETLSQGPVSLKKFVAGSAAHCTSGTNLKAEAELQLIKE